MLVTLTVVVAGIPITERVARLVRYNYGATRIALAGERQRRRARQEGRKKGRRKFLAPGMSPIPPRGGGERFNSFNFTDEIILTAYPDFAVRFASYLRRQILSRLSTGVYKEQP